MLWVYCTTLKSTIGESPYSLVYGTEAFILTEVISLTLRAKDESQNVEALTLSLDLLEEKREQALVGMTYYQNQIARYYNKKVRRREFKLGDLVLRKVF